MGERGTVFSEVSMERSVSFVHLVDSFTMPESRRVNKTREICVKSDKLLMESESDNKSEKLRRHESLADRKFDCPLCGKSFSQKYLGKIKITNLKCHILQKIGFYHNLFPKFRAYRIQCCGSRMFIPDPGSEFFHPVSEFFHPVSEFFHPRSRVNKSPDPSIFDLKNCF
jgi:hypothetical protein